MTGLSSIKSWAVRVALAVLMLWIGLGNPSRPLLAALVPAQAWLYEALMPEFRTQRFALQVQGAQFSLVACSTTVHYLVVRGKAYAPGIDFEASTPARSAPLLAMVVMVGGLGVIRGRTAFMWGEAGLCAGLAVLLAIVTPAIVLTGAQWSTAYAAFEELSRPALLVAASDFLLHGGGLALAAVAVWVLRSRSEAQKSVGSDGEGH